MVETVLVLFVFADYKPIQPFLAHGLVHDIINLLEYLNSIYESCICGLFKLLVTGIILDEED